MSKKQVTMILCVVVGAAGAAAVDRWPACIVLSQMTLYSVTIPGLLMSGVWSDRRRDRYWVAVSLAFVLHAALLFFIRSYFPFQSILTLVPMAIAEGSTLFVLMFKVPGD